MAPTWTIIIADQTGSQMGEPVKVGTLDVLSALASFRCGLPLGWTAEAYWPLTNRRTS